MEQWCLDSHDIFDDIINIINKN